MSIRKPFSWCKRAFAKLVQRDGGKCAVCGVVDRRICVAGGGFNGSDQFTDRSSYTRVIWRSLLEVEHAVPLHNGGSNELDNLRLLCRNCHRSKTTVEHSARLRRLFAEARV